ncbi:MAG: hypothetical protein S4CHLAM7_00040 [Chlamydiae bacterium]|nr:hypothetical protein [Chlamydiota bacterium]
MKKYLELLCSTKNNNSSDDKAMNRLNEIYQELKGVSTLSPSSAKKLAIEALKLKKIPQIEIDSLLESPTHLFCFPYAGGDVSVYESWNTLNSDKIKIKPIEYPGRGTKVNEQLISSFDFLVDYLEKEIIFKIPKTGSFAFFGHSLGALVALELSFILRQKYNLIPSKLFLSACPPPCNIASPFKSIHETSNSQFKKLIQDLNGTPKALLDTEAFETFFLPILRNDFSLLNTYHLSLKKTSIPLIILGGKKDPYVRIEDLKKWQEWTDQPISFHELDGDHFFIHQSNEITEIIKESLCATPH